MIGSRRSFSRGGARLGVLVVLGGCASAPPAPPPIQIDASQVAQRTTNRSTLDAPYRLVFEWSATEPGSRLNGSGVARIEPPYRARLDLFTSNGERVAAAALNGDDLRIANGAQARIPPAALLWGSLGVFRPGPGSALAGGTQTEDGELELRYLSAGGGAVLYGLRDDRIRRIDVLAGNGDVREEVTLVRAADERFPRRATYRDLTEVVELSITLESVENVESYPSDIWTLGL